uniref:Uncharacterized protein n=1 Tax=Acinetobacter phage vB_AbaM-SPB TaxID=3236747 RepID=A0AB39C8S7_9CAUD
MIKIIGNLLEGNRNQTLPKENHISPNCKVTEAHINEAESSSNRLGRKNG